MSLTLVILGFTVMVSVLAFNDPIYFYKLRHHPVTEHREKEFYRWVTSSFLHADYFHLALNMFVFWQFGSMVERVFVGNFGELHGRLLFLILYFGSVVAGDIPTFIKHKFNSSYAAVGASGGVAGILFAYMLFCPFCKLYIYAIIPMYSILAGILSLVYEQWASRNANDNIGHDAHFWGAVFGFIFTALIVPDALSDFFMEIQLFLSGGLEDAG
jgi:membrane associated rhomboid family serine protease